MAKVLIGIPIRDVYGEPSPKTKRCLARLRAQTTNATELYYARGQQISQNSLLICREVLDQDWDYLLYTGDDIIFPPDALDRLMAHDKDFVSGVCTWKTPPYMVPAGIEDENGKMKHILIRPHNVQRGDLLEIDGTGSGFILVKRKVLEGVRDLLEEKIYPSIPEEYRWLSPIPFFPATHDPDRDERYSSDFAFAKLAKMAGFRIFIDCGLICRHRWEGEYDITHHWAWLDRYGYTRDEEEYFGHNPGFSPVDINSIHWGEEGPPVYITATSVGNAYHLENHVAPILQCLLEPITVTHKAKTDTGYVYGWHIGNDDHWQVYAAWTSRFKRVIIQWAGSDVLNIESWLNEDRLVHMNHPRFVHAAVDPRLVPKLEQYFGNVHLLMPPTRLDFGVMPLPEKFAVAIYYPKHRHDFHYGDVLRGVIEKMPDVDFYLYHLASEKPDFEYPNMKWLGSLQPPEYGRMLASVSCMLRLSKHDGRPFSIVEAALTGRRFITNFDMPYAKRVSDTPTVDEVVAALNGIREFDEPDLEAVEAYRKENSHRDFKEKVRVFTQTGNLMRVLTPEIAQKPYDYKNYFEFRYGQGARGAGGPEPGGTEAKWTTRMIRRVIRDAKCEDMLDVGCGSMVRWDRLPLPQNRFRGVDVSEQAIEYARKSYPKARFDVRNAVKDKLPQADAVTSIDVFQHIKPEDFKPLLNNLFDAAQKVLIIKTSVDIPDGYYQFNHVWNGVAPSGWRKTDEWRVPESPASRVFVFVKEEESVLAA